MKRNTKRRCVGYGPHERTCENIAGTPWTDYWCPRCDEMRRAAITKSLEEICASFADDDDNAPDSIVIPGFGTVVDR